VAATKWIAPSLAYELHNFINWKFMVSQYRNRTAPIHRTNSEPCFDDIMTKKVCKICYINTILMKRHKRCSTQVTCITNSRTYHKFNASVDEYLVIL